MKIHLLRHCTVDDAISSFDKHLLSTFSSPISILGAEDVAIKKADQFLPIVMLLFQCKGD